MTTKDYSLCDLMRLCIKTGEIDESGDASMEKYYEEQEPYGIEAILKSSLKRYLIWANGENYEEFLKNAKLGDYPTE